MKKILLIILIYFIALNTCKAEELIELNNVYEIRYKWYKETQNGEYIEEGKDTSKYMYCDKNNYIYSDYTDYILDNNTNINLLNKEVETMYKYYYKVPKKIRNINLSKFDGEMYIEKIVISFKGEIINYHVPNFNTTTWNGESGNFTNDPVSSYISFQLDKEYDPEDISIKIITKDTNNIVNFQISYSTSSNESESGIVVKYYATNKEEEFIPNNNWIIRETYDDITESIDTIDKRLYLITKVDRYYRYRTKSYYCYNTEKEYYNNNYYAYVEDYLPDYNDYKIYYINNKTEVDNNAISNINLPVVSNNEYKEEYTEVNNTTDNVSNKEINNTLKEYHYIENKYLIIASIIISLSLIGTSLLKISVKKCRLN